MLRSRSPSRRGLVRAQISGAFDDRGHEGGGQGFLPTLPGERSYKWENAELIHNRETLSSVFLFACPYPFLLLLLSYFRTYRIYIYTQRLFYIYMYISSNLTDLYRYLLRSLSTFCIFKSFFFLFFIFVSVSPVMLQFISKVVPRNVQRNLSRENAGIKSVLFLSHMYLDVS